MEWLSFWLKNVIFWAAFVAVLSKKTGKDDKDKKDESVTYTGPFVIPAMPYYGFQYPMIVPDQQMFENPQRPDEDDKEDDNDEDDKEDEGVQPPLVRSVNKSNKQNPIRREIRLWPRPCGWEWDGNSYKWGPCNIFFGGPGFPW